MKKFKENIDKQLESSQGKNLFYKGFITSSRFIPETLQAIEKADEIDHDSENLLIDYITNRVLQEFCRVNQYFTFNKQAQYDLREIYVELFSNIKNHNTSVDSLSEKHYANLTRWLQKNNAFAEKLYVSRDAILEPVACSEYSSELQNAILQIDISQLIEPVLDIGCGQQANLVMHLRQHGIEVYGFDRFAYDNSFLANSDWFEYDYGTEKWGTIISNLAFSNHFKHHHFRNDGSFIDYARKYMDILNSLKIGGNFHYAPDLPFIEQYLDPNKYLLTTSNIVVNEFKATRVKRLK